MARCHNCTSTEISLIPVAKDIGEAFSSKKQFLNLERPLQPQIPTLYTKSRVLEMSQESQDSARHKLKRVATSLKIDVLCPLLVIRDAPSSYRILPLSI